MFGVNKKKILFVTLARIDDINVSGIYTDLLKKFYMKVMKYV
jgi:endo-alpha-1,4-polygalactosaminidase (GH114 family)